MDEMEKQKLHAEILPWLRQGNGFFLGYTFMQRMLPQQQEQLKQRIAFTHKKIDALVYELYGLSEEEIKIVEGAI